MLAEAGLLRQVSFGGGLLYSRLRMRQARGWPPPAQTPCNSATALLTNSSHTQSVSATHLHLRLAAVALQEQGLDTVDANRALGLPDDCREYTSVRNILRDLQVESIQLMVRHPTASALAAGSSSSGHAQHQSSQQEQEQHSSTAVCSSSMSREDGAAAEWLCTGLLQQRLHAAPGTHMTTRHQL